MVPGALGRTLQSIPTKWDFEDVFDGVDRGCGDFLYDLRLFARAQPAGSRVVVASRDAGAAVEIPAWCRLTGNRLIDAQPPFFLVELRWENSCDRSGSAPSTKTEQ